MSKHSITGFVYRVQYDFQARDEFQVCWHNSAQMGENSPDWVLVGPHDFEVELPDDFDPRPAKLAALREQELQIRAEFAKNITDLQAQINKLLAIENTVEA